MHLTLNQNNSEKNVVFRANMDIQYQTERTVDVFNREKLFFLACLFFFIKI